MSYDTYHVSQQVTGLTELREEEESKHTHLLVQASPCFSVGSFSALRFQASDWISVCDPNTHLHFSQEEEEWVELQRNAALKGVAAWKVMSLWNWWEVI